MSIALLALVAAVGACSDDNDDGNGPNGTSYVRVVHASADAPNVDVQVEDSTVLTNVPFAAASDYLEVPSGSRNIKVRGTGTTTNVINADVTLRDDSSYTVLAAGALASIAPIVLQDDRSAPAAGNVKVRLVHGAPAAGNVDIYVTAPGADISGIAATLSDIPFGAASDYLEVPAGDYRVRITPTGTKTVAIDSGTLTLASGQIRTGIALEAAGGGTPLQAIILDDNGDN
jgi:hypothetical protein